MKTLLISRLLLTFVAIASVSLAHAAPTSARYLRFDGYASTNNGQINIYEIEAYEGATNVARTGTATTNLGSTPSRLIDGNTTSNHFSTASNNPGQPSVASPHRLQIDFGSLKSIDRIRIFFEGTQVYSFGLFLSVDGVSWTPVGTYSSVNGVVTCPLNEPVPSVVSAAMRPGTTLMDVVFRVDDTDDATVKVRAIAFVDGVRSFAKVLRPVTFVEGTAAKIGDAIPTGTDHTLTWDVGADWNIDLGQVKFEVLAMDARGLLAFDWIAIPAAGSNPALMVSKNSPTNAEVLNALFWQYASGDSWLSLANGILTGNASSGVFNQVALANGSTIQGYSTPFIFKRMNLDSDDGVLATAARAGLTTPQGWHAANRPYAGTQIMVGWGSNSQGQTTIPAGLSGVTAIAAGRDYGLALKSDGTVVGWGPQTTIPAGLSGVTAIAAGYSHSLALKSDGTVVGWGDQTTIPAGLSGVTAIAAGSNHSLALKSDGTVVAWGNDQSGQVTGTSNPISLYTGVANPVTLSGTVLSGVTAIAAGNRHSFAVKSDGTVVRWGTNGVAPPAGLSGVTAIATPSDSGNVHSLALKSDGTVVGWGYTAYGISTIPAGLSGVTAIAAGSDHSLALKSDGTVVAWGLNINGQVTGTASGIYSASVANPVTLNGTVLSGVTAIAAGSSHNLALKAKAP
jgi:Regulator of chromosome condensation (RCC1) repeat/F5/8 type C domain